MPPVVAAFAVVGVLWGGFIGVGAIVATTLGAMVVGGIAGALVGYAFDELLTPDITANSSTYKGRNPVYTVTEGTSIAKAYGRCQLAGNIIRSNDPGEDVLKMIIGHGQGEIDSILSWKINHIEWDHLQGVKWWVDAVASQGSILMWATASVDETFVIDTQTFTWKNARSGTGKVTIGANVGEAVANIVTAITADLTTVTAVVDGWGVVITAAIPGIGGNDIVFTEAVAAMSIDGSGTLGGTTAGTDGYLGSDHFKNTLLGTDSQSVIQVDGADLFTLEACAHRGIAHTGFKLKKNSQISGMGSILVEGRFDLCEPIGGGADVFSRNPAVVMWDFYRKVEGYEIAELDINAFTSLETLCDFYPTSGDGGPIRPPGPNNTTVRATSYHDSRYSPFFSFDVSKPITGTHVNTSWASAQGQTTNQRLNVDLGIPVVLTKIVLVNSHISGASTNEGIQNFVIQGSNTASDLEHVTYADAGSSWVDVQTGLTATQYDSADPYKSYEVASPGTAYRYYSIKIANNHGGGWLKVRDICFWGRSPRYTFDFNFDTEVNINDAKKLIWSSFNGRVIRSQGKLKPVWDWKTMANGSGGLATKTSQYSFTMDNIVKGSFTWHPRKRANKITIEYLDPSEKWKKTPVMEKDDSDIDDRGVIELKSKAYYITQQDVAARRCRRQLYRAMYADYQCELTGFPSSQKLEVYDLVEVTHTLPDWTTKQFIVLDKTEDEQGRPTFLLETYYAGVFDDLSTPIPDDYYPGPPNPYDPPPASTGITATLVGPGGGYDYCAVKVAFTPPEAYLFYSHTVIYASKDDTTYYCMGESSEEDFVINGMGTLYSLGDTCYVKLTNVSTEGVAEEIPDDYDAFVVISEVIQMASFYAGIYDFWGGNASIDHADTKIVLGNLDGTEKIALGVSANAITFAGTQGGFYVDGDGNLRVGGSTHGLKFNAGTGVLEVPTKVRVGSGTYIDIDGTNARIRSSNYVSGYAGAGFTLEPDLLEVGNIACRGIFRTAVFQKDTISVVGGNILVRPGDVLAADMTAADNSTLTLEGNETFSVGHFLRIKDGTDDEWLEVTNIASAPTYIVTRDKSGNYAANANPAWTKGATVVNYGASGDGGVYMTASETNAPYLSIYDHAGVPWTTINTRLRIGNLNGFLGYTSDLYGIAIGETNKYLKYDPTNGLRIKGDIDISSMYAFPSDASLVGYWPFDDGSGSVAVDGSGNGNDGTLTNMEDADWKDGVVGKCLDFDGTNEYVDCGTIGPVATDKLTISFWTNNEIHTNTNRNPILEWYTSPGERLILVKQHANLRRFAIYNSSWRFFSTAYYPTGTTKEHIVITISGTSATLCISGIEKQTISIGTAYTEFSGSFRIGSFMSGVHFLKGPIDELRVYDTALTASEIKALYLYPAGSGVTKISGGQITCNNLSAISADLGSITAGTITMPSTGWIKGGQTAYATGAGFFLGYSGAAYKFSFGSSTKYIKWDGTDLTVSGDIIWPSDAVAPFIVGDYLEISTVNTRQTANLTYTKVKEIRVARGGALRIKFTLTSSSHTVYGVICKNGVQVGTIRSVTTGSTTFSEDVSGWADGDLAQIYAKTTNVATAAKVHNFRLYSDNSFNCIILYD